MSTDAALRRLRAANPVPHPVAADADALFEQIVRETPDARLLRERRRVRRGALVVAAVVVLAAVLASTAPALSNWIGDVIGRDEIESEYARATHQLTLPPVVIRPILLVSTPAAAGQPRVSRPHLGSRNAIPTERDERRCREEDPRRPERRSGRGWPGHERTPSAR
jgi:hypothetical protein